MLRLIIFAFLVLFISKIHKQLNIKVMTLIKSISGIRGTIGGKVGDNLTPVDAVKFASAYGTWLKQNSKKEISNSKYKVP